MNFPESGRGLGHVTPTIFGSKVGYPSDSLASCYIYDKGNNTVSNTVNCPSHSCKHYSYNNIIRYPLQQYLGRLRITIITVVLLR